MHAASLHFTLPLQGAMAALICSLIMSLVTVICAQNQELFPISKCCWNGMQLSNDLKSCVKMTDQQVAHEIYAILRIPYNTSGINFWVPPRFHSNSLAVFFNTLDSEMDLIVQETKDRLVTAHALENEINPSMTDSTSICYDSLQTERVELKRVRLRTIHKCCPEGEKLNVYFRTCETVHTKGHKQDTEVKVHFFSETPTWLPGNFSNQYLKIRYNALQDVDEGEHVIRGDSLHWEILPSPPSDGTIISFWGQTQSGKNVSGKTKTFCFDEVVEGSKVSQFLLAAVPKPLVLSKCCGLRMQFDLLKGMCVPFVLSAVNNTGTSRNRSIFDWLPNESFPLRPFEWKAPRTQPPHFFADLVLYNGSLEIFYLKPPIRELGLVFKPVNDMCYDTIENPFRARVILHFYETKPIFKCCEIGERLVSSADECESIPELTSLGTESYWFKYSYLRRWLPEGMLNFNFRVSNNKLRYMKKSIYPVNIVVPVNSNAKFRFIQTSTKYTILSLQGRDVFNNSVSTTTDAFCFDEIANGSLASKVLLAVKYDIMKCCPKHLAMGNSLHFCLPLRSENAKGRNNSELQRENHFDESHWIPDSLWHKNLSAVYGGNVRDLSFLTLAVLSNDSLWRLDDSVSFIPTLVLHLSTFNGRPFELRTTTYCFDYVLGQKKMLLFKVPKWQYIFNKCCYPGEILSTRRTCEKYEGKDWRPGLSNYSSMFPQDSSTEITKYPFAMLNVSTTYSIQWPPYLSPNVEFTSIAREIGKYATTIFCMDFQRTSDGTLREVVGSLTNPEFAWEYERVRPVGLTLAMVGVTAAAGAAAARAETRSTAHGRALVAHALSLTLAHALQLAGFIVDHIDNVNCYKYAYSAYFFMMAANWWLTAITFNMYMNFRKPLGALSPAASGGERDVWRRFFVMAGIACGGAAVVTAISVGVRESAGEEAVQSNSLRPSFTETRSCIFRLSVVLLSARLQYRENLLGALVFYYAPSALLTAANVLFVVLTALGLRKLRRGTSILRKEAQEDAARCFPQRHVQQAMMYAKLLLSTGVLEIAVEGAAWTVARIAGKQAFARPSLNLYLFPLVATGVDLLRAVALLWLCVGPAFGPTVERARKWLVLAWRRARGRVAPVEEDTGRARKGAGNAEGGVGKEAGKVKKEAGKVKKEARIATSKTEEGAAMGTANEVGKEVGKLETEAGKGEENGWGKEASNGENRRGNGMRKKVSEVGEGAKKETGNVVGKETGEIEKEVEKGAGKTGEGVRNGSGKEAGKVNEENKKAEGEDDQLGGFGDVPLKYLAHRTDD